jgi:hypothetical protein
LGAGGYSYLEPNQWETSVSYRFLHSSKIFIGTEHHPELEHGGPDLTIHSFDLAATYGVTKRFSATLTLPISNADLSNSLDQGDHQVHSTTSSGIGDVRLTWNTWVFDPETCVEGNLGLSVGVKAPTGNDRNTSYFFKGDGTKELRPVDISAQPGDGGFGIVLEMQGFRKLFWNVYGYTADFYLINPREENGTVFRGTTPENPIFHSVPDQYLGRIGISVPLWLEEGIALTIGGRIDGIPVHDLIGDSGGFRRPGFVVYVDPGVTWAFGNNFVSLNGPAAVDRDRQQSVLEKDLSRQTGTNVHGGAGFADFLIVASYARRF